MQAGGLRLKTLACVSDVPSSTDHVSRARTAVARTARPAGAVLATRLSSADSSSSGVGDAGRCGASALRCPLARWRAHLRLRDPDSRGSVAGLARDGGDRVGNIAILPKHLCRLRAVPCGSTGHHHRTARRPRRRRRRRTKRIGGRRRRAERVGRWGWSHSRARARDVCAAPYAVRAGSCWVGLRRRVHPTTVVIRVACDRSRVSGSVRCSPGNPAAVMDDSMQNSQRAAPSSGRRGRRSEGVRVVILDARDSRCAPLAFDLLAASLSWVHPVAHSRARVAANVCNAAIWRGPAGKWVCVGDRAARNVQSLAGSTVLRLRRIYARQWRVRRTPLPAVAHSRRGSWVVRA